jgi:hypothetical protein
MNMHKGCTRQAQEEFNAIAFDDTLKDAPMVRYGVSQLFVAPHYESGIAAIASISTKKFPGNFPTSTAVLAGFGVGSIDP